MKVSVVCHDNGTAQIYINGLKTGEALKEPYFEYILEEIKRWASMHGPFTNFDWEVINTKMDLGPKGDHWPQDLISIIAI